MTSPAATLWLADHPRVRRALVAMTLSYGFSLVALLCAPSAVAAGGSAALGWTGLHDTDGVPIGYYFLSLVSAREAATNNGQEISIMDPGTWGTWIGAAMERAVDNATAAWWLGMFAGAFIFIMAASLWFLRFALSTGWLVAIATFGLPLYNAVSALVSKMMLGPIAITICVLVAGYHMARGNAGRGWAMIGTAIVLTVLLATVFSDPIEDLYSDHGLLALGRGTGLEIAQSALGTSFASGASLDAKLDALMSHTVTAGVRHPLQVLNFGMVVDDVGRCQQAYTAAMMSAQGVDGSGPAHAMANCGAPQALAYAQRLGGSDATLSLLLLAVAAVVGFFFWYVGLSVMLVGIKSLYFGILVGPSFLIGMMGFGRAMKFAKHCGREIFMHVVQFAVFEVYLAVSAIGLTWVLVADVLGASTATTIPRVLMMAVAGAALWMGFRFVDRSFHTDDMGTIGRQVRGAWHAGTGAVREEAGSYRDHGRRVSKALAGRRGGDAGGQDSPETAATRRVPGIDWFTPRASGRPGAQNAAGAAPGGSGAHSAAKTTAKSAATKAALTAVKVAAPEVAAPVAAATKAAGAAGHVLKSKKTGSSSLTGTHKQGSSGDSSPVQPRQPRPAAASSNSDAREPTQATTMAGRSSGRRASALTESGNQPPSTPRTQTGTIEGDVASQLDDPQPRAARRPRPPREIGP
ncbi:MAG: hypothetical protein K0U84_08840 [Actinomycetia bacterium]|nr:hypothetical protein [Actinomycetes bacterium]